MSAKQKRVATLQDLSCFGRCSLTVALPILSAASIEVCPIPTAVLAAHTGYPEPYMHELSDDIERIAEYWKSLSLSFDAIYTGYLSSFRQVEIAENFIEMFNRPGTMVLVDPAMAEDGKLYTGFEDGYVSRMGEFCMGADVIIPNLTEAQLLLGMPYDPSPDEAGIRKILEGLSSHGAGSIVLTGVSFEPGVIGAAAYDVISDTISYAFGKHYPAEYYGSGDVFASTLCAALLREQSLPQALKSAVVFTGECVKRTYEQSAERCAGLRFEQCLSMLDTLLK